METGAVAGSPVLVALTGSRLDEVVLVVAVVALVAILVVVRLLRSSDRRRRKSAVGVYVDRDAARYGRSAATIPSPVSDPSSRTTGVGPASPSRHGSDQPMARSFTSPKKDGHAGPPRSAVPVPIRPSSPWSAASAAAPVRSPAPSATPAAGPSAGLPAMAEPPVAEMFDPSVPPPLPGLRPKASRPTSLPAMPPPPPATGSAHEPDADRTGGPGI